MINFSAIATLLFLLVIFTVAIKFAWSYLVKRIFPGAVQQNLIVEEITWLISLILAIIFILLK